jgi:CubicO group peptidase (beta-lactamase class C family)
VRSEITRRTLLKRGLARITLLPPILSRRPWLHLYALRDEISKSEYKAIANIAEDFLQKFDAPGLSLTIARDGLILCEAAFGVTGHESGEWVRPKNLFRIASVSKPITSAAIFSLIEQGRLHTQDTVFGKEGVLGTEYGTRPYGIGIDRITVDNLLTHTSGGWDISNDPMFTNPAMSQAELISWTLDNVPLKNPSGTNFSYSNFGYCVLGRVIERITGRPYADYVKSSILMPSGIQDMRIGANSRKERLPEEVTYYGQPSKDGQNHYDDPYAINVSRMDSHGGWIATSSDLVRFAGHVDGFDARRNILKVETIRTMATPSSVNPNYARGWNVNAKGHWWHGGDLGGTSAILVRTASRFCWAALTNTRREPELPGALDDLVWDMVSKVSAWNTVI